MIEREHLFPHPDRDGYDALSGPGAWYPVEAGVPGDEPVAALEVPEHVRVMLAAAEAGDWPAYFRALGLENRSRAEAAQEAVEAPEPEWTTRDGWPGGFVPPGGAERLRKLAEAAGWEVRVGYSRPFRPGVRTGEWVKAHYVGVWARKGGRSIYGRWWSRVTDGKLSWSWDGGTVNGWRAPSVGMLKDAIEAARS